MSNHWRKRWTYNRSDIRGYSKNEAEQQRSEKSANDRCPFVRRQMYSVQLHASKQQHCQRRRQQERQSTRHSCNKPTQRYQWQNHQFLFVFHSLLRIYDFRKSMEIQLQFRLLASLGRAGTPIRRTNIPKGHLVIRKYRPFRGAIILHLPDFQWGCTLKQLPTSASLLWHCKRVITP